MSTSPPANNLEECKRRFQELRAKSYSVGGGHSSTSTVKSAGFTFYELRKLVQLVAECVTPYENPSSRKNVKESASYERPPSSSDANRDDLRREEYGNRIGGGDPGVLPEFKPPRCAALGGSVAAATRKTTVQSPRRQRLNGAFKSPRKVSEAAQSEVQQVSETQFPPSSPEFNWSDADEPEFIHIPSQSTPPKNDGTRNCNGDWGDDEDVFIHPASRRSGFYTFPEETCLLSPSGKLDASELREIEGSALLSERNFQQDSGNPRPAAALLQEYDHKLSSHICSLLDEKRQLSDDVLSLLDLRRKVFRQFRKASSCSTGASPVKSKTGCAACGRDFIFQRFLGESTGEASGRRQIVPVSLRELGQRQRGVFEARELLQRVFRQPQLRDVTFTQTEKVRRRYLQQAIDFVREPRP
ncbi:hypothetical protein HPB50_001434 [Hyalomma asiaticum]|uniref:Uncharacterized protein n=1 Tax=Hyalomma asiaticum TaxID=266040 RepID=A0ACB7T7M2_HYAAI|nr:hypothetical protein HPB50_001434 [Hyalomma asiaticum]